MKTYIKNLKHDLPAGLVVYLVALPLCLGVALASTGSSELLFSGIIAGVAGGIIVGLISGSALGVSGPAAGLVTIVAGAIGSLGSFEAFLAAVVLAGIIQLIAGFLKAGVIGYYFPSSVIKGMLAAIGIILILKQIPHAFGFDQDFVGDEDFFQKDGHNTLSEIYYAIKYHSTGAVIISIVSLALLILFELKFMKKLQLFKFLPGALFVVLAGTFINIYFVNSQPEFALAEKHLVGLPVAQSSADYLNFITFPDFSILTNPRVYFIALTLALVASLETLLSIEATDKLDPQKRKSPANRELVAQGFGNIVSGMLGGLPVTQVIVRSSANINSGGHTKVATIFHGLLLLLSVLTIPMWLNMIPLSALAMILIMVGYKLAKPSLFVGMSKLGWEQFIPFAVTVVGVVFTDLLYGIAFGILASVFYVLRKNYRNAYKLYEEPLRGRKKLILKFAEEVSFLNKASISNQLDKIDENSVVVIDASRTKEMDYDVIERIDEFKHYDAKKKHIDFETIGVPEFKNVGGFKVVKELKKIVKSVRTQTKRKLLLMTPEIALNKLKDGNRRFVENLRAHRDLLEQVNETSSGQFPFACVLSCIDSRTSAELIFDQGLGDIFSVRVAGNVVNEDILGSMEYACKVAGSKLVVVLGHTKCGAVTSACKHVELGNVTFLLNKIQPAVNKIKLQVENIEDQKSIELVSAQNVRESIQLVVQKSPILAEMIAKGEIIMVGGMYDVESGYVDFFEEEITLPAIETFAIGDAK